MKDKLKPHRNLGPILAQCKCGKGAQIRGACSTCYAKLMHQIEDGKVTEASLIKKGLLQPGKGLLTKRDNEMFSYGSKQRGNPTSKYCLAPGCTNLPYRRGLCNTHRVYAHSMLKRGKAKQEDLISRGLMLPANAARNPIKSKKPVRRLTVKRRNPSERKQSSETCEFKNCNDLQHAKGLCKVHYSRVLRKFRKNPAGSNKKKKSTPPSW